MKVIGSPIEGMISWADELALLFVDAAAPEARAFNHLQQLRGSAALAQAQVQRTQSEAAFAANAYRLAGEELAAVENLPTPLNDRAKTLVPLCWCGIVAVILLVFVFPGFVVLTLIPAAGLWRVTNRRKQESQENLRRVQTARAALEQVRVGAAHYDHLFGEAQRMASELAQQMHATQPRPRFRGLVRLQYPVRTLELAGYPLLVDGGGASSRVPIRLPDLAADPAALARIQGAVERAKTRPVLLGSSDEGISDLGTVHGEERDLKGAVTEFTDLVESIPTFEENLPLVPKSSPLMAFVASRQREIRPDQGSAAVVRSGDFRGDEKALRRVGDLAGRLRGSGRQVDASLRSTQHDLTQILSEYQGLRSEAVDVLQSKLADVMHRSYMAYVHHYCPRCNRVPAYFFRKLGIDVDTAHERPPAQLIAALQHDPEVAQRLLDNEQLRDDLNQSWMSIQEIRLNTTQWSTRREQAAIRGDFRASDLRAMDTRVRALKDQEKQEIDRFRGLLRKCVIGSARPVLELSRQASLHLDPDAPVWTCGACNTRFDDAEDVEIGRMLRIKDELLMPMWNHLWTEKDDFRKKELFRTNEQIQRLIEKESGALRDVAEQYRADMRPVRENLIISSTEAGTKREQLESMVDALAKLGVIDRADRDRTVGQLNELTGGDLSDFKAHAEAKESVLNLEPQAQMSRRATALDPVAQFLSPEVIFQVEESRGDSLRLAASDAEGISQ